MSDPKQPDLDLDAIEMRAAAATPGPWHRLHDKPPTTQADELADDLGLMPSNKECNCAQVWSTHADCPVAYCATGPDCAPDPQRQMANAMFVAHARADVPALVARVRVLEALLREASQCHYAHRMGMAGDATRRSLPADLLRRIEEVLSGTKA